MVRIIVPSYKTVSDKILQSLNNVNDSRIIFMYVKDDDVVNKDENIKKYINDKDKLLCLRGEPAGPLCSCLMAIDEVDNEDNVLVLDRTLNMEIDFNCLLKQCKDMDCGVVTIDSQNADLPHVLTEGNAKEVIEASQDRVISDRGIAGVYYFKHGCDFVECAKNAIRKGCSVENKFYLTAAVNEMILKNKIVMEISL